MVTTYLSDSDPRFGQIDHQRVLRKAPRTPGLLGRQIRPVHREMNLHNQRHRVQATLVPTEQGERLLMPLRIR